MTAGRCDTCRGPTEPDGLDNTWTDCRPCARAIKAYARSARDSSDANYVYHELAHHVVLFRSLPRCVADWRSIEEQIELWPVGRAQVHELRVIALQYVAARLMGWAASIARFVEWSWAGIDDFASDWFQNGGRPVVTSRRAARAAVRDYVPTVSARNLTMYVGAVREMRGERA